MLLPAVLAVLTAQAQQMELRADGDATSVLVRGFEDANDTQPAVQATWRLTATAAPDATFSYQRLSASSGRTLTLRQLLVAAIEQYLDQRVHFTKQGVHADLSDERLLGAMNAIARTAADEFKVGEGFAGFSEPTMEQLERITHIDWSKATFGVDAGSDQDKYLAIYYYVRSQRQELERQLRADLLPLANVDLLAPAATGTDAFAKGRSVTVPTVCSTVYDDQNFLCALDLTVSDTLLGTRDGVLTDQLMANLATKARQTLADDPAAVAPPQRLRKRDRWLKAELDGINARIDQLDQRKELWALRDRMDDMEARVEDMGMEIHDLKEGRGNSTDNPIANLSDLTGRNITVRFEKGSSTVDGPYALLLNEVFEQLARSPGDRILITGYTDRSGDPAVNLRLSQERARAVRDYLLARGVSADRLLVNYYGDSRSNGRDPSERRVEVEWLR